MKEKNLLKKYINEKERDIERRNEEKDQFSAQKRNLENQSDYIQIKEEYKLSLIFIKFILFKHFLSSELYKCFELLINFIFLLL